MKVWLYIGGLILVLTFPVSLFSQELEPRSLTNVPVGMNFGLIGYAWTQGNIILDPAISIEDLNANVHSIIGAYARSLNVFGKSGKVDVVLPFGTGDWRGLLNQEFAQTSRTGFGDPRIRFSVNLSGSPALSMEEYKDYVQKTIFGFNMQVILPLGQYFPDRLINLGSNRFTFRPQFGVSHRISQWYFEAYAGMWLFTRNSSFWGGNELKQNPLITWKVHIIRSLPKGIWIAMDGGYANGGITFVNGVKKDSHISTFRLGGTVVAPLGKRHSIKLFGYTTIQLDKGSDYEYIALAYQYRWGGK